MSGDRALDRPLSELSGDSSVPPNADQMAPVTVDSTSTPRPRGLTLRASFSWTLVGNVVYSACQWGMIVVLAKLSSAAAVGQFAYGLALSAPLFMFSNLNLRVVQATDATGRFSPMAYVSVRVVTTLLALATAFAVAFTVTTEPAATATVCIISFSKAIESMSDLLYGFMQRHQRMDLVAKSLLFRGALSLALFSAALGATRSVVWASAGLATSWALVLCCYDSRVTRRIVAGTPRHDSSPPIRPAPASASALALVRVAAPLGVVMLLISLNTNVPRYFLEHHAGASALGIFAAMSYLMVAGTTVVGALGQSAAPHLSNLFAAGDLGGFRALTRRLVLLTGVLGGAGVLIAVSLGETILRILYRPEYAAHASVFVWVATASAVTFSASIAGYALTAAQVFTPQAPLFVVVCATTALASYALVPRFGISGASYALLAGAVVQLGGSLALLARALTRTDQVAAPRGLSPR